jgi:hypothetical protein
MPPELKLRLTLEGSPEVLAKFEQAVAKIKKGGRDASSAFTPLQGSLAGVKNLLGTLAAVVSVGALANFAKDTMNVAFAQKILAEEVGTTVGNMTALTVASKMVNVEEKVLTSGLGLLGRKIDSLKAGAPEMIASFGRLRNDMGKPLSAKDFVSDDIAVAADIVSRAMDRIKDGYAKSAIAAAIMGRNGKALIPVFEQIARMGGLAGVVAYAKRTGFYVDEATVVTMQQLVAATKQLELVSRGAMVQFLSGFGPQAIELLRELTAEVDPKGVSAFEKFGNAGGKVLRIIVAEVRQAIVWVDNLGQRFNVWAKANEKLATVTAKSKGTFVGEPGRPPTADDAALIVARNKIIQEAQAEQVRIRKDGEAKINALMVEADDENTILAAGVRRKQALQDEAFRTGAMTEAAYRAERKQNIDEETAYEIAAREKVIQALYAGRDEKDISKDTLAKIRALWKEIEQIRTEATYRQRGELPTTKGAPGKPAKDQSSAEAERTAAEAQYRAAEEANNLLAAQAKTAYEAGEASLDDYLEARRTAIEKNLSAELDMYVKEWKLADQIADPEQKKARKDTISAKTDEAVSRADIARLDLENDARKEREQLEKALAEFEDKRRTAEGEQHASRMREIETETEAYRKRMIQNKVPPAQAAETAQQWGAGQGAREDFRYSMEEARRELQAYEDLRQLYQEQVRSGQISEATGMEKLKRLDLERLPGLKLLEDQLRAMAAALGPDAQAQVEAYIADLDKLQAKTTSLSTDIKAGLANALADAFSTGANEAQSFIGWLGQMALQVALMIQRLLALKAAQGLVDWAWGGRGGGGGGGSGTVTTIEDVGAGAATGGLLRGPGGPTDDAFQIWASNREWVAPAWLTGTPGVLGFFEGLRTRRISPSILRGFSGLGSVRPSRGNAYAAGGLVARGGEGASARLDGYIGVGLDGTAAEALVLRVLESKHGQRAMIRNTSKNRRAFGSALGG